MSAPRFAPTRTVPAGVIAVAAALCLTLAVPSSAHALATPIGLGTATDFAIVSYAGVTNVDSPVATVISGNVGVSPLTSTAVTGFTPTTLLPGGEVHTATTGDGSIAAGAKAAASTAYDAGLQTPLEITAQLGGRTLGPDAYGPITADGNAFQLTGDLVLDGQGSYDSIFLFTANGSLTTASSSRVLLQNGAQACNVFWRLGDDVILGASSSFVGTAMAYSAINLLAGAQVEGRLLAQTESVTLISNTITTPTTCLTGSAATTNTPVDTTEIAAEAVRTPGATTATAAAAAAAAAAAVTAAAVAAEAARLAAIEAARVAAVEAARVAAAAEAARLAALAADGTLPDTGPELTALPFAALLLTTGLLAVGAAHVRRSRTSRRGGRIETGRS